MGVGRWEMGDGKSEMGDGRWEMCGFPAASFRLGECPRLRTRVQCRDTGGHRRWELEAGAEPAVSAVRADVAFDFSK